MPRAVTGDDRPSAAFTIATQGETPSFLGLTVAERNRRLAVRMGARPDRTDTLPRLTVPADAVLTPALFAALPLEPGAYRLVWHAGRPPLFWQTGASAGTYEREVKLPESVVLDAATPAARHRSAWILLRASGKPQDHWLARHVHRRISRVFSYVFLRLGLTANAATAFTFAIGLLSAWFMAQTSHLTMAIGGFLLWFASIADGIDGEMARLTMSESTFGEQLDTAVDQLTYAAGMVGVLVGWWRQGIGVPGLALAAAVVCGIPGLVIWAMSLVRRARRTEQRFVPLTPIDQALATLARTTRAPLLRLASLVFVLFRREAFSVGFFAVSIVTGRRAAIPMLLLAGAAVAAITLARYRSVLGRTLEQIVDRPGAAAATGPQR